MHVPTPRPVLAAAVIAALLAGLAAGCDGERDEPAAVEIHAHRGGPLATLDGKAVPVHPEESMSAFRQAHEDGYVVELDVKLTRDRVPVVIHDPTLDRTTTCSGPVAERTAEQLGRCRLDLLGTGEITAPNPRPEPIPRLAEVLAWARAEGTRLNVEIKNLPVSDDFDPTRRFARTVVAALEESGIARERVLVQSFWTPNLEEAKAAGWRTVLLTPTERNGSAPAVAARRGYDVLSPEWPLPAGFLEEAGGRPVAPWTLNSPREIRAALDAGVEAIVSDNPGLVRALAERGDEADRG